MEASQTVTEHTIWSARRRTLAERCYMLMRHEEGRHELFVTQCSCGSTGSITRLPHNANVGVTAWTPDFVLKKDGVQCQAVSNALAAELPAALDAPLVDSLPYEEIKRLEAEFRREILAEFQG